MRIYSLAWSTVTALAVLAGIAFALTIESVPALLSLFATATICVAVIWANLRTLEAGPARFATYARIAGDSAAAGLAAVAALGLGLTVGAWLFLLVAALTVTSPWSCDLVRHRARRGLRSGNTDEPRVPDVHDGHLDTWTDGELYSVWQATTIRVAEATGEQATTAADARRLLLGEIERRYPEETRDWMSADAALNGEPPRFLWPPSE